MSPFPHGYGAAGNPAVWGDCFDAFLTRVMSGGSTAISELRQDTQPNAGARKIYDLNGRMVSSSGTAHGGYIVKDADRSRKVLGTMIYQ